MTRGELIGSIVEAKMTPEERKARRKKWAKRAAIGVGVAGAVGAAAYFGPKAHHAYGQRKIRNRVHGNIVNSQRARKARGTPQTVRFYDTPQFMDRTLYDADEVQRFVHQAKTRRKVAHYAHDSMPQLAGAEGDHHLRKPGKLPAAAKSLIRHVHKVPAETYSRAETYSKEGIGSVRGDYPIFGIRSVTRKKRFLRRDKITTHKFINQQGSVW